jgi:hypothetical protein
MPDSAIDRQLRGIDSLMVKTDEYDVVQQEYR